ncbi:MAG TPA: FAD-dependent oxidoreductase, partial [Pyrinomonadaceae bacterium]|nr:FAD-dependent oxidoreductase [Pyrinomonadaceae bacterium]
MSKLKPLYPHEFLSWMAVPGYQGIYILGSFARHVTIYSQQMRAFNLIDALCKTGQLRPKTKVAVVGGGVAGLTAAAAAAVRDARVTVIESDKDFFPIQRNAGNRYLHPHIYDWPLFEAETGRANTADFPFLGWEADDADKVFRKLKESWDNLLKDYPRLTKPKTVMEANVTGLHRDAHWIVETDAPYEKNPGEVKTVEAEIVILAVGFGRELGRADVMRYWEQAPFDAVPETTLLWLVSGYGDGGLTDLMRLCIDGFRHDEFVKKHEADPTLATKLRNLLTANERENVRSVFDDLLGELGEESLIGPDQLRMKTKV